MLDRNFNKVIKKLFFVYLIYYLEVIRMENKGILSTPQELKKIKRRPRVTGKNGCSCNSKKIDATKTNRVQNNENLSIQPVVDLVQNESRRKMVNLEQNQVDDFNINYVDTKQVSENENKIVRILKKIKENCLKIFKLN